MSDQDCPVCGDEYEYTREEPPDGSDGAAGEVSVSVIHDIDQLCDVEEERRWDRICHQVTVTDTGSEPDCRPVVRTFRHHWE